MNDTEATVLKSSLHLSDHVRCLLNSMPHKLGKN